MGLSKNIPDFPEKSIQIFGWDISRAFRNENKNIIRIELKKYDKKKDYNIVRTFDFIGDKKE